MACLKVFALFTLVASMASCGTKTGNPPGSEEPKLRDDPDLLGQLITEVYLSVIDGITTGDYLYRSDELRVIESNCLNDGFQLRRKTDASHSVHDEAHGWQSTSALSLSRSNFEKIFVSQKTVPCQRIAFLNSNDLENMTVESRVDDSRRRDIQLLFTGENVKIHQTSSHLQQGKRMLSFNAVDSRTIAGMLGQNIDHKIETSDETGKVLVTDLSSQFEKLAFKIEKKDGREFNHYTVENGKLTVEVSQKETLTLDIHQMAWLSGGCYPATGKIIGALEGNGNTRIFELSSSAEGFVNILFENGKSVPFLPQGCVLNEK